MDLKRCEAFLSVVSCGSFTAAAEVLNYTQSGVTRMMYQLEQDLGFALFIRQKRGVALTENGRIMYPHIKEIVDVNRRAREVSDNIRGVIKGAITVGCYYSVSSILMPEILKKFKEAFPLIKVKMIEGGNTEMAKWLNENAVDLCFCGEPGKDIVCDWIPLYKDPMVVWLPPDHPKSNEHTFKIKDLEQEAFIHTSPNHDTDQDRLIEEEGLHLNIQYSTQDGFTTYNMVEAGLGVSFNQKLISKKWNGQVVEVPLEPAQYVNLGLAVPSVKDASPATRRFIDYIQKEVAHEANSEI
ncbi:MAG: LysR family transcriptional regulator [Veillonella sp.]|uniref:LysR family transcriptional regulator n=1 Tax=Veillonella sp. TaxID=1926307 RepID=UPI0025D6BEFA|nr:LysR family transcriptional regulator [Veillonella sp.]MBS4912605.1 LysR family transcriptional regulator [Veillonella sp.]